MKRSLKGNIMTETECFISVDIEATGPTPGKYSMYELGASVVGEESERFAADITLLSPRSYLQETLTAMGIPSVSVLYTREKAQSPEKAMCGFARWVKKVSRKKTPVFTGNNAPFDWMFVAWYFTHTGIKNPFGHNALDMKAYFMGLRHSRIWKEATLKEMAHCTGISFTVLPHNAIEDALIQAKIFAVLLAKAETLGKEDFHRAVCECE